jgi:hypothetical protein
MLIPDPSQDAVGSLSSPHRYCQRIYTALYLQAGYCCAHGRDYALSGI